MRAAEVARAMGMVPRTYENLESGTGRITFERIVDFAEATNSDPIAILSCVSFGSPEFAVRCADNKLMTIMLIAMKELDTDLGDDITLLSPQSLVGGFTRLTRDLAQHVRARDTFAEEWLKAGSSQLNPAKSVPVTRKLEPRRT